MGKKEGGVALHPANSSLVELELGSNPLSTSKHSVSETSCPYQQCEYFIYFGLVCLDGVPLCSLGWSGIYYADQASLERTRILPNAGIKDVYHHVQLEICF